LVDRLSGVANARRAAIVKEENGKVWARVYPKTENRNGDLARNVLAAAGGWQVEELHTEEGRLDEVFRSITLPETAKATKP
jgi:ABC-2 type transport system ATP-binding protein